MKKIFILLLSMLCICSSLYSKEIKKENAYINAFSSERTVWKSRLELGFPETENPICEHILYGDTVVNNKKWKIVNISEGKKIKGLIRTEGKKVIFSPYPGYEGFLLEQCRNDETIIYDFSLEEGDEFGILWKSKVIKVDSVKLLDGEFHKKNYFEDGYSYIEGLGSDTYQIFSMLFPVSTMNSFSTFICCHTNDELLYINPNYTDCEGNKVNNGYIENNNQTAKVIYVNGRIKVLFEDNDLFDVFIYDVRGSIITHKNNSRYEAIIDLKNQINGIYFVKINSEKYSYTHKIYCY